MGLSGWGRSRVLTVADRLSTVGDNRQVALAGQELALPTECQLNADELGPGAHEQLHDVTRWFTALVVGMSPNGKGLSSVVETRGPLDLTIPP